MPIAEEQISILIPTFRQPQMVRAAVVSALATGAGEILVSDDKSGDDTAAVLAELNDPRLKVIVQEKNLGLWPNHLWLIHRASRPWIKILQHDDRITPGGLAAMAAVADDDVAVVGATPIYHNLATGVLHHQFVLDHPLRFTSEQYLQRLLVTGNELSTPSATLFRKSSLAADVSVWRTEVSADLLINVIGASRGDVVLVPPGPIWSGDHPNQDSNRQGMVMSAKRLRNSLYVMAEQRHAGINAFAGVYGACEALGQVRSSFGALRRGRWPGNSVISDTICTFFWSLRYFLPGNIGKALKSLRWKYGRRDGRNIAHIPGVPDGRVAG